MTFLEEVHGLTLAIRQRCRDLAGSCIGFGVDDDGCLCVYQYSSKNLRRERIAEAWYWGDIIDQLEMAFAK